MGASNERGDTSLALVINDRGVMDALGVLTVVRLGVLFAGEVFLLASYSSSESVVLPVMAIAVCWICYQGLRRSFSLFLHDWFVICADLVMTGLLLLSAGGVGESVRALWFAYVLVSAIFMGLAVSSLWPVIWVAGMVSCVAVDNLVGSSSVGAVLVSLGVASGVVLGNKWRSRLWEVGELMSQVAGAREERRAVYERLTIARDLHDSLAKSVHGIRMLSESLDDALREEDNGNAPLSRALFESADEASREARIVLDGLRVGGEENTVAALKEAVVRWGDRSSIVPVFDIDDSMTVVRSSPDAMWQLHRIVGEALVNVEKHSGAKHLYFTAKLVGEDLLLDIADDGCGVPGSLLADSGGGGHYGVQGMKERAAALGARFEISSSKGDGAGVRMRLVVPRRSLAMLRRST